MEVRDGGNRWKIEERAVRRWKQVETRWRGRTDREKVRRRRRKGGRGGGKVDGDEDEWEEKEHEMEGLEEVRARLISMSRIG